MRCSHFHWGFTHIPSLFLLSFVYRIINTVCILHSPQSYSIYIIVNSESVIHTYTSYFYTYTVSIYSWCIYVNSITHMQQTTPSIPPPSYILLHSAQSCLSIIYFHPPRSYFPFTGLAGRKGVLTVIMYTAGNNILGIFGIPWTRATSVEFFPSVLAVTSLFHLLPFLWRRYIT